MSSRLRPAAAAGRGYLIGAAHQAEPMFYPKCRWLPKPADRWICSPKVHGYAMVWGTFSTRGIYPRRA